MPSSIVGRTGFSALMAPGIWRVYEMTGKERPLEYDKVINIEEMPWNPITDQAVAGLGTVPTKAEGAAFSLDAPVLENQIQVSVTAYGLAVEFTYEAWEDEKYGVFKDMAAEMARSGRNREEVVGWAPLNSAFAASPTGFDGSALCSTSHQSPVPGGPLQANRPSPDIGFSITGLQGSVLRYHSMLNDRGLQQVMFPSTIIMSAANMFAAREILGSSHKAFTADNEVNSLVPEDFKVMISHYLNTSTNWFLNCDVGQHDVNFAWRTHVLLDSFDDPWTKNAVFTIYFRITSWFGDWRGVDGSTG